MNNLNNKGIGKLRSNFTSGGAVRGRLHLQKFLHPRGQELLEFALIVPILFMFIFGVIDLARLFHAYGAITNAAREGARYASRSGINPDKTLNVSAIQSVTKQETENMKVNSALSTVTAQCCTGTSCDTTCAPNDKVVVRIQYNFHLILQSFIPQAIIPLHAKSEMLVGFTN
jgi:Flp pilus assembly protein TadG